MLAIMSGPIAPDEFKRQLAKHFSGLLRAAHLYGSHEPKQQNAKHLDNLTRPMQEHAVEYMRLLGQALDASWMPALPLYKTRAQLEIDIGEVALQAEARLGWEVEWRQR